MIDIIGDYKSTRPSAAFPLAGVGFGSNRTCNAIHKDDIYTDIFTTMLLVDGSIYPEIIS